MDAEVFIAVEPANTRASPTASAPALEAELAHLRARVAELERDKADLEIALTSAVEHGDVVETELYAANTILQSEIRERIVAEGRLAKVLEAVSRQMTDLEVLVQTLTDHGDAMESEWLMRYAAVDAQARMDPLTCIANRRQLDEALDQAWKRCRRSGFPLSVAMCDLDHFKSYNDTLGHAEGDEVLKTFAEVLRSCCKRAIDLPARMGGEEFVVLFDETGLEDARAVAEAINRSLSERAIPHPGSPKGRVTVSIGVACIHPADGGDPAGLLARADTLLYAAKAEARDVVRCDTGPMRPAPAAPSSSPPHPEET